MSSSREVIIFDPDGDVYLLLKMSSVHHDPVDDDHLASESPADELPVEEVPVEEVPVDEASDAVPQSSVEHSPKIGCQEVEMRVSSKHLSLASKVFSNMFADLALHSTDQNDKESRTANLDGDDLRPLLALLNIIHGRNRCVPREVDLCFLSQIVFLIDKYELHEVAEILTGAWFEHLRSTLPEKLEQDLDSWLLVCYELRKLDEFERLTMIAITETRSDLEIQNKRVPRWIIQEIGSRRLDYLNNILGALSDIVEFHTECSQICPNGDCDALALGKFMRALSAAKLYPIPESHLLTVSITDLITDLFSIAESIQRSVDQDHPKRAKRLYFEEEDSDSRTRHLDEHLRMSISEIQSRISGLRMDHEGKLDRSQL